MNLRPLLKFYRYLWAWENYPLLLRTVRAARLVRGKMPEGNLTPRLAAALPVIDACYLTPQPGWHISDAAKVTRFASFVVNFPTPWGKCLQRSLIAYRLLNGYGVAAHLCIGVDWEDASRDGHVWVMTVDGQAMGEPFEPGERYQTIFVSPHPHKVQAAAPPNEISNLKYQI